MKRTLAAFALLALAGTFALTGCTNNPTPTTAVTRQPAVAADETENEIRTAMEGLDPADRKLAEAQKWCAVNTKGRLGGMDTPYKLMVNGEPIFLCCEGCKAKALADPEKTLAKVAELKQKAAAETKTP